MQQAWHRLEPFIQAERDLRGAPYVVYFEDLVCRAHTRDPRRVYRELGLRQFTGPPDPSGRRPIGPAFD